MSENAEYTAAKDAQEKLEIDIYKTEEILSNAYPIDTSLLGTKVVEIGNSVKVLYDGDDEEDAEVFKILHPIEVDSANNIISYESPLGAALIGHKKGDEVTFKVPGGANILQKPCPSTK